MENSKKLQEAGKNFGKCAIAVYDRCKNRRSALSLADKLLNSCTLAGGYVEGIIINGDDGERLSLAVSEIYRARYMAKVIGENRLCREKTVLGFLRAANALLHALLDSEPGQTEDESSTAGAKGKRTKKQIQLPDSDPDGFDDVYVEPQKKNK